MVPIILSFTQNYIVPAAVTVSSVLRSSAPDARFEFICLLAGDIQESSKNELRRMTGDRASWTFINLKGKLGNVYVDPRYSEAASYRLMLPELLPDKDKVIYLDCDIVVRNDLAGLYGSIKLEDNYLAAVYEAPLEHQVERFRSIGCDPMKYFNSGFLVMNLARMREEGVSARLIEALKVDYLEFPDQDALNQVCQGRVLALPPYYNGIRTFFLPQYKPDFLKQYSEADWKDVQDHGTIHYTGGKPWNMYAVNFDLWWEVFRTLPAGIRDGFTVNKKVKMLAALCSMSAGRWALSFFQNTYRKLRYNI